MTLAPHKSSRSWTYDLALAIVLVIAAYFRLVGIDWDGDQHLHPDERFLTGVVASLQPVDSVQAYFDTTNSTLNPNNRGSGFFVYGTLPVFMVRYVGEAMGMTGYGDVHLVGRALSAFADLGVVALVYFTAARLFDKRVGLLAAVFSALAVMQIQQSHFWTVDNFVNFFTLLTLFFAVRVASYGSRLGERRLFNAWDIVGFGVSLGLALASKVSVAPLALALPAAMLIRILALPREQRVNQYSAAFWWLVLAGVLSAVTFRIFQPYAFQGIGVGGWLSNLGTVWQQSAGLGVAERIKNLITAILGLNPHWVETMASLAAQVNGDADWPPSMQWARRSFWFGLQNIVSVGLGWPLALASLGGFAWAGWRIYKGDWRRPAVVLWGWGLFYFLWQSNGFNPTMRYFLPFYPVLLIFGAWGLVQLWDLGVAERKGRAVQPQWKKWLRPTAGVLGAAAVIGSALWAWAFVQVYQQDVSRIQAANWIYANLPGPITLTYMDGEAQAQQPLPVSYQSLITPEAPLFASFLPASDGALTEIKFKYVLAPIQIELRSGASSETLLGTVQEFANLAGMQAGDSLDVEFEIPDTWLVDPTAQYQAVVRLPAGSGQVQIDNIELRNTQLPDTGQPLALEPIGLTMGEPLPLVFTSNLGIAPNRLLLHLSALSEIDLSPVNARVTLTAADTSETLAERTITLPVDNRSGDMGTEQTVALSSPIEVERTRQVNLQVSVDSGAISLLGSAVANESSWDDGLPLRIGGYDGFGGIYQGDLNFEMYWDEDEAKRERFLNVLDRTEYIFITSSRQWGSLPRIPERFPLVIAYYRALIGCPPDRAVDACFIDAQVGTVHSDYGFELVQVFENAPRLGPWQINDQGAEEAYTVYDHPKVFIFRKTADYDSQKWKDLFSQVDLSQVVRLTPKQASGRIPPNLMLPPERLEQQRAGGTWSDLFDTGGWINSSPWVSAFVWYVALTALGIAVYPLLRWLMPGLRDGGYSFARLAGLLLFAYFAWMGASLGLTFSRGWLAFFAIVLVVGGAVAAWFQREQLRAEWKKRRNQFLWVEGLFLAFFALMLLIRLANPDLWHPAYGGEKPMDFSYFNAVLKSTTFPPYDPWFSGGYINYYYWGFVLVGSLVKLLGIVPAVAYNLILPSLFAMLAVGAYGLASSLWAAWAGRDGKGTPIAPEIVGVAAAIAVVALGNLGSLTTLMTAYAKLGAEGAYSAQSGFFTQLGWAARGVMAAFGGQGLPIGLGEWYWNPTRIIIPPQGETGAISEFPLFTFTYADLHAHMIALPVTVLGLAWSASAILSKAWNGLRNWWQLGASLLFGGIILGSLRPINTWDLPAYLLIATLAVGYAVWRYGPHLKRKIAAWQWALGLMAGLALLSFIAYQPFATWYRQGYSSIELWTGSHTRLSEYVTHWGIFLFFIMAWLIWETRQWLAETPLSSLRKLNENTFALVFGAALLLVLLATLLILGATVAWLVIPLLLWVGLLFLRPAQDEIKRLVLFLVGTALFLTLMVEVIRLQGDISRMNTVFKFYMQSWVLLAIAAALALGWTLNALRHWLPGWRSIWQTAAVALVACGALFMITGVAAKMGDRMEREAPHTLDGLAYMPYSVYFERDQALELRQDYEAIRWMQENVAGSPVIVEGHTGEYRWGSRFTINTGLPAVIGWNWHQRQQREFVAGNDIWARVGDVETFYTTTDTAVAEGFLQKYDVKYIIVGQLEQAVYPGAGLDKFETLDGRLWREVYRADATVIYEVLAVE